MKTLVALTALLLTVKVFDYNGNVIEKFTNVIEVIYDHEKKVPPCNLIRYVENGRTNEFHAWMVPILVTTNK